MFGGHRSAVNSDPRQERIEQREGALRLFYDAAAGQRQGRIRSVRILVAGEKVLAATTQQVPLYKPPVDGRSSPNGFQVKI